MKYNNSLHQFLPALQSQEIPDKIPNIKNFLTANDGESRRYQRFSNKKFFTSKKIETCEQIHGHNTKTKRGKPGKVPILFD